MKYLLSIIAIFFAFQSQAQAALGRGIQQQPGSTTTKDTDKSSQSEGWFSGTEDLFYQTLWFLGKLLLIFIILYTIYKTIRLIFELYYSKNLRYLQITLPRADSKLDKEKETKKDFKEKIGQMSMFYKAIHKLAEAGLRDTLLNFFFGHSKVALELVYDKGEVTFFIVTYENYVNLISQHITSIYNDAEILRVEKKDYVKLKEVGYKMRAASLGKEHDDVYPIKSFKYLEDDPINNFTNVF
jgi:hypothetical protein